MSHQTPGKLSTLGTLAGGTLRLGERGERMPLK